MVRARRWSIATRLTIHYTLVSTFVLLLISLASIYTMTHLFSIAEKQYLIDEQSVIEATLKSHPNNLEALRQEVMGVPASLKNSSYFYYIRIRDPKNNILMATPGADQNLKNAPFNDKISFNYWISGNGKPYLLMSAPIEHNHQSTVTKRMEMALDVSYPEKLIKTTLKYILLFFFLLVFIFLVLGKWVAKRALNIINEMADVTKRITIGKLSHRLDHDGWPHELKDLGSAFNDMISGIEKTFHRLNECSNELAHELRIPINNLIGCTEIILSREREKEDYKELLASNLEEFRRLSKLTEDILFLARSESPDSDIKLTKIHLYSELSKICDFYKYATAEKNITLKCQKDVHIVADSTLLNRALINLLNNAIKYTPEKGEITFRVHESNSYVEIHISDTGIGISEENINRVFERFFKGRQIDTNPQSFGLGLPIVKSIMHFHKGFVTVSSKLHYGTTFTLHFPKILSP